MKADPRLDWVIIIVQNGKSGRRRKRTSSSAICKQCPDYSATVIIEIQYNFHGGIIYHFTRENILRMIFEGLQQSDILPNFSKKKIQHSQD